MTTSITPLETALASLLDALSPPPRNDRERDGAIQRFEYTFELTWKVGKRKLEETGIISTSPRSVIRDMAQQGWIMDAELWLGFLRARNYTSHIYSAKLAELVFSHAQAFAAECSSLCQTMKKLV